MISTSQYKGYEITYTSWEGTTEVTRCGEPVEIFPYMGYQEGNKAAKEFIDQLAEATGVLVKILMDLLRRPPRYKYKKNRRKFTRK
jgi:hypothetical protein